MARRAALLVVAALVSALIQPGAWAHDPTEELEQVQREIAAITAQIDQARQESRRLAGELAAAQQALAAAQAEVAAAQAEVDAIRADIAAAESQRDVILGKIEAVSEELATTQASIRSTRHTLEVRAVSLYMDASASMVPVVLSFESAAEAAVGLAYTGGLAEDSQDLLATYRLLLREEERQKAVLEEARTEVEELLTRLDQERVRLEEEAARLEAARQAAEEKLSEIRTFLDRLNAEIAAAEQHKEGLEADAKRLEAEIAARQQTGGQAPGKLAWPVSGWVSSPFGYRVHPIFGTRRLHTGIDIAAAYGSRIGAAGPGTVILAGPYGGYGNAVVIDHGGGLSTLYAHQSRIAVSVGQTVGTGETVGYVGCTGFCTGAHLHFETRENGAPVDPMKYLGG
jgi:murein DD-endopeptidase MepM/ murein hydrolase activator NlpD